METRDKRGGTLTICDPCCENKACAGKGTRGYCRKGRLSGTGELSSNIIKDWKKLYQLRYTAFGVISCH